MVRISFLILLIFVSQSIHLPGQDPFGGDSAGQDPFGGGAGQDPFALGNGTDPFGSGVSAAPAANNGGLGIPGFSGSAQAAGVQNAQSVDQTQAPDSDPVVRLLRVSPPKSPKEMARGLTWMTRLKRWDEVGRLLDLTASMNWSAAEQAELSRAAGAALWVRLRGDEPGLSDAHRQLVGEIMRAPSILARDPKWIDQYIDQLGSPALGEQRLAQLKLQDAGAKAVERLVARLLDGDARVSPVTLAATALMFGSDGQNALRAACHVQDPERASRVFLAMADLPSRDFTCELACAVSSQTLPAAQVSALSQKLSAKYGGLPASDAIEKHLRKDFENRLLEYFDARTGANELTSVVWRTTADGKYVEALEVPESQVSLEALARVAALRCNHLSCSKQDQVSNAVALLQRAYQVSPGLDTADWNSKRLVPVEGESLDSDFWQAAFAKAGEWQMHGAAVRALQMLGQEDLPTSSTIAFLSDILKDPRPVIRYTALEVLADWDPVDNYKGSEQAIETALEMTHLGTGPQALVIGLHTELRQAARQQILATTNGQVAAVNSARGALAVLDEQAPTELIFIVDRVADQSLFELIQRLRNSRKGQLIPIAVLTDELYAHERRLISENGGIVSSLMSRDPEQMRKVVDEMLEELDTEPLHEANRARFAASASNFLVKVTSDRERYAFYPIDVWQRELGETLLVASNSSKARFLSGLGNKDSQCELVELIAHESLQESERMAAAEAFGTSVRRFGNRLGQEDVVRCYDLYNELGPTDPIAARSLGFVLDVIEAQAGKRSWPEGL